MPIAPPHPCTHPGCGKLVKGAARCEEHNRIVRRKSDGRRGSSTRRGYGYKWQIARKHFLASNPLCIECNAAGITKAAQVVDHKKPHRGDQSLMWDQNNWQALCTYHHNIKTATEDGGFGRR